jgi:hypothetical protein
MSKNKVIKSVGFNVTNPDDAEILKAIKRRNFSRYVKKLLLEDIREGNEQTAQIEPIEGIQEAPKKEEPQTESAAQKMARMREQMKRAGKNNPGPKTYF